LLSRRRKKKGNGLPDLSKYIIRPQGRPERKYVTYEEGARIYRMEDVIIRLLEKWKEENPNLEGNGFNADLFLQNYIFFT